MSVKKHESLPDLVKTRRRITTHEWRGNAAKMNVQLLGKDSVGARLIHLWTLLVPAQ